MATLLTELVSCAGCASKLAAGELARALRDLPMQTDPGVLIDYRTSDDAGVYKWAGGPALVQTVDFFTPIVDDPFTYGQIAAANALSDVYAMGGRPLTALAIAGFPRKSLDRADIAAIFRGGFDKLREAGVALLGGHTVQDDEMKFGYAVTGTVDPERMLTNGRARPGDALILTKPLGTGVIGTAIKFERAPPAIVAAAVTSMCMLNRVAATTLATVDGVHSCTDVTGFGLIGHGSEMAAASQVTLRIRAADVPIFDGVRDLVRKNRSGGMASNQEHFEAGVDIAASVDPDLQDLLYDPQTSGGLLVAVDQLQADLTLQLLERQGVTASRIGAVNARGDKLLQIR
jgi:selenide,water dikinase